jgi:DeoD family purine-nucleoside phosphorylase
MSVHINAKNREIASVVLMPGDPLRAKYIAENWLSDVKLVASTRNIFYYTGTYKDVRITIGASGMGCPSIGIYSYELYNEYNVEAIIRIGTAGSYHPHIKLYDVINVENACSESTYAKFAFDSRFWKIGRTQLQAFHFKELPKVEIAAPLQKLLLGQCHVVLIESRHHKRQPHSVGITCNGR